MWPQKPDLYVPDRFPTWALAHPDGSVYYGFPMLSDNRGLKVAHHRRGQPTDPDSVIRDVLPGDEEDFRPTLKRFLPSADGPLLAIGVCLYTNSMDSHFIIDRHPVSDRVTFACGFSGHGFKFAPVIGEVLADLAVSGQTALPIGFLRLNRFASRPQ